MVDESGNARITDFGPATVARDSDSLMSVADDQIYTSQWTAPEILGSGASTSMASDVFSFGMVVIEVWDC